MTRFISCQPSVAVRLPLLAEIIHGLLIVESSLLRCNPKRK